MNENTSPPSPHPKQWYVPCDGRTLNDGDFSSWNGHSPFRFPPPALRSDTYSPTTTSIRLASRTRSLSASLIRPATPASLFSAPRRRGPPTDDVHSHRPDAHPVGSAGSAAAAPTRLVGSGRRGSRTPAVASPSPGRPPARVRRRARPSSVRTTTTGVSTAASRVRRDVPSAVPIPAIVAAAHRVRQHVRGG